MVLVLNFIIQDDFKVYGAETPSINTTNISIYCLEDGAKDYISIPEDYLQQYQIKVSNASKVSYRIISGESVKVSDTGLVMPNIVTYYWTYTGNYYVGTTMPDPEVVYDKITNKIKFDLSFFDSLSLPLS